MAEIGDLIDRLQAGEPGAQDALFAAAYPELRQLARSRLRDGGRSTVLDTTALVHEFYLRVQARELRPESRRAYFAYASKVMRSVIVDAVRERQADRRGGGLQRLTLDTGMIDSLPAAETEILEVDRLLEQLAQVEPRLALIVELRYFGGFSDLEVAEALGVTDRTVRRDWDKARLLLGEMMGG